MKRNNKINNEALLQQYRETVAKQNQMIDELNDELKKFKSKTIETGSTKLNKHQIYNLIKHLPEDMYLHNNDNLTYDYNGIKGTCYVNIVGNYLTFKFVDNATKNYTINDLKLGQTIRLKTNLIAGKQYGKPTFVTAMKEYVNKNLVIDCIDKKNNVFGIVGSIYQFAPEMIESISNEPLKTVKNMNDKFEKSKDALAIMILSMIASKNPEALTDEELGKKAIDEFIANLTRGHKHD